MSGKDYDEKVLYGPEYLEDVGGNEVKLSLERSHGPNEPVFIVLTIDGDRNEFELAEEVMRFDNSNTEVPKT